MRSVSRAGFLRHTIEYLTCAAALDFAPRVYRFSSEIFGLILSDSFALCYHLNLFLRSFISFKFNETCHWLLEVYFYPPVATQFPFLYWTGVTYSHRDEYMAYHTPLRGNSKSFLNNGLGPQSGVIVGTSKLTRTRNIPGISHLVMSA